MMLLFNVEHCTECCCLTLNTVQSAVVADYPAISPQHPATPSTGKEAGKAVFCLFLKLNITFCRSTYYLS